MPDQASRADQAPKEPEPNGMFPPFGTFPHGTFPFGMFPFFGLALPLWCSLFVFPLLDWQRVVLMAYEKTLKDPAFAKLSQEEVRRRAKLLLGLYLEGRQSRHELGEDMLDWQSDWVQAYLRMLEGVLGSVERRTMG